MHKAQENFSRVIANRQKDRRHLDFYPTPPSATVALIDRLKLTSDDVVWECACGSGDMTNVFTELGIKCIGSDITDGRDFLKEEKLPDDKINWIITNPPFNLAEQFIKHADQFGVKYAFLLKSQYWHSANRIPLFRAIKPSHIFVLTWRIDFKYKERGAGLISKGSPTMDHIWVVQDHSGQVTQMDILVKPFKSDFNYYKSTLKQ